MEQTLVILVAATGVRISEAMGLKWEDIDYQNKQINLRRVWVKDTIVERLKTDDSEAPVPLTDLLADCLRGWQRETMYARPTDWIFASTRSKGRKPRSSSVLTFDHLRPAVTNHSAIHSLFRVSHAPGLLYFVTGPLVTCSRALGH